MKNNVFFIKIFIDQASITKYIIYTTFKVYNENNSIISSIFILISLPKAWVTKLITKF